MGFQYGDLILLALIAVFVALRLRSTLGKNVGHDPSDTTKEDPRISALRRAMQREEEKDADGEIRPAAAIAARPRDKKPAETDWLKDVKDESVAASLKEIRVADPNFSLAEFLQGAKGAFEWVLKALNEGNAEAIKKLTSKEVFEDFEAELARRHGAVGREETTLVSIEQAEVIAAELKRGTARITVQYETEQVSVTRDNDGNIVAGDASHIETVIDEWVFERSVRSKNPNWTIVSV